MRGPVTVIEDGNTAHLLQNISWQPPVSGEVMMYLIKYGMGGSTPDDASFNVTPPNTFIVLKLSIPGVFDEDMLVYNIWISVLTKSQEEGNATMLTIHYSSE